MALIHQTENGTVATSDSALVAYLKTKGIIQLSLEFRQHQAVFIFESTKQLHDTTINYYSNVDGMLGFHKAYRDTLRDIKRAERGLQ